MPALTQLAKDELSHIRSRMLSSVIAEVSTMFRFAGGLQIANGKVALHAELSHPGSAKHLWDLAAQAFSVEPELVTVSSSMRQNHFLVRITRNGERVARRLGGIGYGFGAYDSGASMGHVYAQLHAHDEHIALADVCATAEVLHDIVTQYLTHR